jgi:hypothetical protein
MNEPKLLMNWTGVLLVILEVTDKDEGATWKQIKDAIEAQGWEPKDWLTEVRGPLQRLIDEGRVKRVDREDQSEVYIRTSWFRK